MTKFEPGTEIEIDGRTFVIDGFVPAGPKTLSVTTSVGSLGLYAKNGRGAYYMANVRRDGSIDSLLRI